MHAYIHSSQRHQTLHILHGPGAQLLHGVTDTLLHSISASASYMVDCMKVDQARLRA